MHYQYRIKHLLFVILLINPCLFASTNAPQNDSPSHRLTASISSFLNQSVAGEYKNKPIPCREIKKALNLTFVRGAVDIALFCEAFNLANTSVSLKLRVTSGYKRALLLVEKGSVNTLAETVWEQDGVSDNLLVSRPLIERGEFKKGIFTLPNHPLQKEPAASIDLSIYSGITIKTGNRIGIYLTASPLP